MPVSLKHVLILINVGRAAFLFVTRTPGKLLRGKAMNQSLTLAIGMLVGTALGAAAVNGLHAQGKTLVPMRFSTSAKFLTLPLCHRLSRKLFLRLRLLVDNI